MFNPKTKGGVPLSLPSSRRGSARGGEPCAVPCHLCAVLGCTVHRGARTPALPARAPGGGRTFPARPGGCARSSRGDYLLHPALRSPGRSNCQSDSWTARRSRAVAGPRSSACERRCATGSAVIIFSSAAQPGGPSPELAARGRVRRGSSPPSAGSRSTSRRASASVIVPSGSIPVAALVWLIRRTRSSSSSEHRVSPRPAAPPRGLGSFLALLEPRVCHDPALGAAPPAGSHRARSDSASASFTARTSSSSLITATSYRSAPAAAMSYWSRLPGAHWVS